jgi:hypothetical protein
MTVRIGGMAVARSKRMMFIKMEGKMTEERDRMKILIAYDGSECAESAIDDLKRGGRGATAFQGRVARHRRQAGGQRPEGDNAVRADFAGHPGGAT